LLGLFSSFVSGKASGITVVDIDALKPDDKATLSGIEWYKECVNTFREINTLKASTPSGGLHLFFKFTDLLKTTNKIGKGENKYSVDIKNKNGQVVVSPSKGYSFFSDPFTTEIMDCPSWFLNEILRITNTTKISSSESKKRYAYESELSENEIYYMNEFSIEHLMHFFEQLPEEYCRDYDKWSAITRSTKALCHNNSIDILITSIIFVL